MQVVVDLHDAHGFFLSSGYTEHIWFVYLLVNRMIAAHFAPMGYTSYTMSPVGIDINP
jgi:hypothetical protein